MSDELVNIDFEKMVKWIHARIDSLTLNHFCHIEPGFNSLIINNLIIDYLAEYFNENPFISPNKKVENILAILKSINSDVFSYVIDKYARIIASKVRSVIAEGRANASDINQAINVATGMRSSKLLRAMRKEDIELIKKYVKDPADPYRPNNL